VGRRAHAGITFATAILYLRVLAIVAIFNLGLAHTLMLPVSMLSAAGFMFCAAQYRWHAAADKQSAQAMHLATSANPLELGAAAILTLLFVFVSLITGLVKSRLGISGIYAASSNHILKAVYAATFAVAKATAASAISPVALAIAGFASAFAVVKLR
jgi:uncharacterized membrane protein (DUF4010 family)